MQQHMIIGKGKENKCRIEKQKLENKDEETQTKNGQQKVELPINIKSGQLNKKKKDLKYLCGVKYKI